MFTIGKLSSGPKQLGNFSDFACHYWGRYWACWGNFPSSLYVKRWPDKMFNNTVCCQLGQPTFKEQENLVYNEAAAWNTMINFTAFFPSLIVIFPLGAMANLVSKKKMLLLPAIANLYAVSSIFALPYLSHFI